MSQLYNLGWICYNIYAEANKSRGLFFLPKHLNIAIIVNSAATLESPNLFASAAADKAKKRLRLFFVQLNRKAQAIEAPEPLEDHGMIVKKTACSMIARLKAAVNIPKFIPTIPKESPGNYSASDSLSFLTRLITPGLSPLFPLLAASIVASLLPGAASSISERS